VAGSKKETNFSSMSQSDIPHGRNGKHKGIVTKILSDLDRLQPGKAIKIPLADLGDTKENVRSALNRAVRKQKIEVSTSADDQFLYVWPSN
jgi:hypothetical protein